jgi:hypothetical protein
MPFSFSSEQKQTAIWPAIGLVPGVPPMHIAVVLALRAEAIPAAAVHSMRIHTINSSTYRQP